MSSVKWRVRGHYQSIVFLYFFFFLVQDLLWHLQGTVKLCGRREGTGLLVNLRNKTERAMKDSSWKIEKKLYLAVS